MPQDVKRTPYMLAVDQRVLTGPMATALIVYDDGSKAEIGPRSNLRIERSAANEAKSFLKVGTLKAWVRKFTKRRFRVKTPSIVASVRGTEFRVQSFPGGRSMVDLHKGLLDVQDRRGKTFTLRPGQRLEADYRGAIGGPRRVKLHTTAPPPTALQAEARREVGLDMGREAVLAAAAREIKLAEYQQGKALIDVNGYRVRLEQYILRPQPDQFKLVVLNERQHRFDYFYYLGTFNTSLPTDLSAALGQLGGSLDNPPDYYLTSFETGRSNTIDSLKEIAQGGHPIDVNSNADVNDDVTSFFDSAADQYIDVTGRSVYQTLFDRYGFYVNDKLKYGWTGTNLKTYSNRTWATTNDPITGAALAVALPVRDVVSSFPESGSVHQQVYESYTDGTSITWDNYIISDEGTVASTDDFDGITSGSDFRERLLLWNYEQVITATEFEGRTIDLVVAPKILIQAGLIQ